MVGGMKHCYFHGFHGFNGFNGFNDSNTTNTRQATTYTRGTSRFRQQHSSNRHPSSFRI
jgi:hypothetical protein